MLPVTQNVAVANKHILSPAMGPFILADAKPVSEKDDVEATLQSFRYAVSRGVYNACDHYFLYLLERLSPMQVLEERSEEHTSELQSRSDLVCRLLLEKKKKQKIHNQLRTVSSIANSYSLLHFPDGDCCFYPSTYHSPLNTYRPATEYDTYDNLSVHSH